MGSLYDELTASPSEPQRPAGGSLYDDLTRREEEERRLRATLTATGGVTPDRAAALNQLSQFTGVPRSVIETDEGSVQAQARLRQILQESEGSPVLRSRLTNPTFTELAQDDVGVLASIEKGVGAFTRYVMGADGNGGLPRDLRVGLFNRGAKGTAGAFRAITELAARPFDFLEGVEEIGGNPLRRLSEGFGAIAEQQDAIIRRDSGQVFGVSAGVQSLGQNAKYLPLALLGPAGIGAALTGMMAEAFGDSYQNARDKGISEISSLIYGASNAAIEYATERLPLQRLIGDIAVDAGFLRMLGRQIALEIPGEQIATVLQDMNEWAVLNPEKPFSAYLAERPSAAAETLIATIIGSGGNVTLAKGVDKVLNGYLQMQAQQTDIGQQAMALQQLLQTAAQSKLRERDPAQFRETMGEMLQANGTETVYVDAQVLNQMPAEFLAQLPGVTEQMADALATNSTVELKLADVLTVAPGTGVEQTLIDNIRLTPDSLSQAESRAAGQEAQQLLQQQAERVMQQATDQVQTRALAEGVKTTILDQLNTAGRFSGDVNEAYATLVRDFYVTLGGRLGINPQQAYERYPLRVVAGSSQQQTRGEQVLRAPAPAFVPEGQTDFDAGRTQAAESFTSFGGYTYDGQTLSRNGTAVADLKLRVDGNRLVIDDIEARAKGQGQGTEALGAIVDAAHAQGLTPVLFTDAMRGKAQQKRLRDYYERLGFVPNKGATKVKGLKAEYYFPLRQREVVGAFNQAAVANETEQDRANSLNDARVSPRMPTAVKATEDAMGEIRLQPDLATAMRDPNAFAHNINLMSTYPNFQGLEGTAEEKAEAIIQHAVDNLLWLHDHWKPEYRERSKLWYVGGNRIATRWAERFGISSSQVAAVIAATSPQKDWFQNVSIAERVLEAVINNSTVPWDAKMSDLVRSRDWGGKLSKDLGYVPVRELARFEGKTLRDLYDPQNEARSLLDMGVWIRAWDEANNPMKARVITPEGGFTNRFDAGKTGKEIGLRWQSFVTIAKTLQVLMTNDRAVMSDIIGANHKVRSFYNNIIAPYAGEDVTIDTHAVAAALLRPLGSSSTEVFHNFGGGVKGQPGPKNSAITGLYGTYAIYAEAYRRAAQQRGILPREMQSITWEAVRGLFRPEQKNEKIRTEADQIWAAAAAGEIDGQEARNRIEKLVGGIVDPAWVRSPAGTDEAATDSSYAGELPASGVSGGGARPVASGTGGNAASGDSRPADGVLNQRGGPTGLPTFETTYTDPKGETYSVSLRQEMLGMGADRALAVIVEARTADGNRRAVVNFDVQGNTLAAENTMVAPVYRRRGLAEAMYRAAREAGYDIMPGRKQTEMGERMVAGLRQKGVINRDRGELNQSSRFSPAELAFRDLLAEQQRYLENPIAFFEVPLRQAEERLALEFDITAIQRGYDTEPRFYGPDGQPMTLRQMPAEAKDLARQFEKLDKQYADAEMGDPPAFMKTFYALEKLEELPKTDADKVRDLLRNAAQGNIDMGGELGQREGQGPRGTFSPSQLLMTLNENANLSTFLHETGHFFLEVMADVAAQPGAPADAVEDMNRVLKWFGVPDLATWNSYDLEQKRPHHERWAESFEQYLLEGKAPNRELRSLFRKFRNFLTRVYGSLQQFVTGRNLQLSDDIRQVMDRLVATDEQIAEAQEIAGMAPSQEATDAAVERLQSRSLRDLKWAVNARSKMIRNLQKQAAGLRKAIEEEVTAEVEALPAVRAKAALDALRKTTPESKAALAEWKKQRDATLKTATDEITANLLATEGAGLKGLQKGQFLAKNKRRIANEAEARALDWERTNPKPERTLVGSDLEIATVADSFGYSTVEAMLQDIQEFGDKKAAIEAMTDQRMLERHGDLVDQRAIEEAATEAVHNEARARALATELSAQREMLTNRRATGKTNSAGRPMTVDAMLEAARQFAENVAGRKPIKDLKAAAWSHLQAERRAAKAWERATAAGDTQEAVQAKQDQLLNHEVYRALQEAMRKQAKAEALFARVLKGSTEKLVDRGYDPDVVSASRAILAAYGLAPRVGKSAMEYLEVVEKNDPEMYGVLRPAVEATLASAKPYDQLTVDELDALVAEIEAMQQLARRSRQMEVDGNMVDLEEAADELKARMEAIGVPLEIPGQSSALTPKQERTRWLQFARALTRRMEQWSEAMDGGRGPFTRLVFGPVKAAADRYRADRVKYRKAYQALLDNIAPALKPGEIAAPELNYTFGKGHNGIGHAELLHALLHTGNESNKRKLLLGRGWATENEDGTLDTSRWDAFVERMQNTGYLRKEHYDFAQGVWDLLEDMKPLAQKAHRDVFGRYFAEVTADAFTTPFGAYRGGYVPAQADPRIVTDAALRRLAEMENENMAFSFPATNRGFTKGRVEYNRPLILDLRTIGQHMDKVLLFSHMEPAVRDVNRLLRDKGVSSRLSKIDPAAYEGALIPWLNRSARQQVETPIVGDGRISRVLSVMRNRAGAALMFANLSNTVQQITGFSTAAIKVRPALLLQAAAQYIAGPKKTADFVAENSIYMRDRMSNEIAAINDAMEDILLDPSVYKRAQNWTQKHAYFLQAAFDNVLSPIVWTGAYNQALEAGASQDEAVKAADAAVRQTQGSTLPEDVSRIETGPAAARMFTQFLSYFNMVANTNGAELTKIAREVGLKKGAGKALYVVTMGLLAPLWVAEAIAIAFRGGPEDEDEDGSYLDDWLAAVFGMGTIKGTLAMVPFVGQVANAGIARLNDNPTDDRISLSPAVSLLEGAVGSPVSVYKAMFEDGNARTAVRDVASLISVTTGLPAIAVARPLGYLAGVADDRIEPTSEADLLRGLVTGAVSPESKQ